MERKSVTLHTKQIGRQFRDENGLVVHYRSLLAHATWGEIQALRKENLYSGEILVAHSWDRVYGLKGTKSGANRIVPISEELYRGIRAIADTNKEGLGLKEWRI